MANPDHSVKTLDAQGTEKNTWFFRLPTEVRQCFHLAVLRFEKGASTINFICAPNSPMAVMFTMCLNCSIHGERLGLPPENIRHMAMAFMIGNVVLLLKPQEEWYGKPTVDLNARITLEVRDG